jgi:hypothetical protein
MQLRIKAGEARSGEQLRRHLLDRAVLGASLRKIHVASAKNTGRRRRRQALPTGHTGKEELTRAL